MEQLINDIMNNFLSKKDPFTNIELNSLDKNSKSTLSYLSDLKVLNSFIDCPYKKSACLSLFAYYIGKETVQLDVNSTFYFIDIPNILIDAKVWEVSADTVNVYLNGLFHNLFVKNSSLNEIAINLFSKYSEEFTSQFTSAKSYLFFYAYKTKNYKLIEKYLSTNVNNLFSKIYVIHYDFQLMCYFKGLIHLSLKQINESIASFIQCFDNLNKNERSFMHDNFEGMRMESNSDKVYTYFQAESLKRLILLNYIAHPSFKKLIEFIIKSNLNMITVLNKAYIVLIGDTKGRHNYGYHHNDNDNQKSKYEKIVSNEKNLKSQFEKDKVLVSLS